MFKISPNTLNTWLKQYREKGEFVSWPRVYNHGKLSKQAMLEYLDSYPDAYQYEMAQHWSYASRNLELHVKKDKALQGARPLKNCCIS